PTNEGRSPTELAAMSLLDIDKEMNRIDFNDDSILTDIADLFAYCSTQVHTKFVTTLLYMALRRLGVTWRKIEPFLKAIGAMTAETAHKWVDVLINEDFDVFTNEYRGGKRSDSFYDTFPDLEVEARQYVLEGCTRKDSSFTAEKLARFIDKRFYEVTNIKKVDDTLVRSVESCRLDIRRFGAKYESNTGRPYFLGHEREDVVEHREDFVKYFLKHESDFYTFTDGDSPKWTIPAQNPTILICEQIGKTRLSI
ncbi:unnamed protein product, partial [Didymodactylos carnosus]